MSKLKMWRSETRPSTDVAFFEKNEGDLAYYQTAYIDTGVLLSEEATNSDDQLVRTRTLWWNMVPGLIEILAEDATLNEIIARSKLYNDVNGITRSELNFEIYDANDQLFSAGVFPNK